MQPTRQGLAWILMGFLAWQVTGSARAEPFDIDMQPAGPYDAPGPLFLRGLALGRRDGIGVDLDWQYKRFLGGTCSPRIVIEDSLRWAAACCVLSPRPALHLDIRTRHLRLMIYCERVEQRRLESGRVQRNEFVAAVAAAEVWVLEALLEEFGPSTAPLRDVLEQLRLALGADAAVRPSGDSAEAAKFGRAWKDLLEQPSPSWDWPLSQMSLQRMQAECRASRGFEAELDAREAHLRRMLFAGVWEKTAFESGRMAISDFTNPFSWAARDAKYEMAKAIFDHPRAHVSPEQLEKWWTQLASIDTARACRAGWEIAAAGQAGEAFLRQRLAEFTGPEAPSEWVVDKWCRLGEVLVIHASPAGEEATADYLRRLQAIGESILVRNRTDESGAEDHALRRSRARDLLRDITLVEPLDE